MSAALEPVALVGGQQLLAHAATDCIVTPCPIHSPSDHHMADWPQQWRPDRRIIERICPCGIGHPDPDVVLDLGGGAHGCCGCCQEKPQP